MDALDVTWRLAWMALAVYGLVALAQDVRSWRRQRRRDRAWKVERW